MRSILTRFLVHWMPSFGPVGQICTTSVTTSLMSLLSSSSLSLEASGGISLGCSTCNPWNQLDSSLDLGKTKYVCEDNTCQISGLYHGRNAPWESAVALSYLYEALPFGSHKLFSRFHPTGISGLDQPLGAFL